MTHGSTDRVPASSLILFASIAFTLVAFAVFTFLWKIPVPPFMLIAILGLQAAALFLGSSKVLTQLGAASLSALAAVIASIVAVFLLFPPLLEPRVAGAVGGITALIFVLASFVAASREDPVPLSSPEPLDLGDLDTATESELVKYGDIQAPDASDIHEIPLSETAWEEVPAVHTPAGEDLFPDEGVVSSYEFDELSESRLGKALGHEHTTPDQAEGVFPDPEPGVTSFEDGLQGRSDPDPTEKFAIPEDWVEETARVMAYEMAADKGEDVVPDESENNDITPAANSAAANFNMRTRYKVLDEESGKHYGTWYGDEGYSTLDPSSLSGLIGRELEQGELRIVKLDWSNFAEVEVHIRIEEVMPIDLDVTGESHAGKGELQGGSISDGTDAQTASGPGGDVQPDEAWEKDVPPATGHAAPCYKIYDRRTIQPMGEYVPEGDRSRIDRLTLYRMFPEYDFKTFEIDSIRWEEDEVRIFIKGERKDGPRSRNREPERKNRQRNLLEDQ